MKILPITRICLKIIEQFPFLWYNHIEVHMKENTRKKGIYEKYFKRALDFIIALLALILLSPILLIVSLISIFFPSNYKLAQISLVSLAITSSSSVGLTYTATFESAVEILTSSPLESLAA